MVFVENSPSCRLDVIDAIERDPVRVWVWSHRPPLEQAPQRGRLGSVPSFWSCLSLLNLHLQSKEFVYCTTCFILSNHLSLPSLYQVVSGRKYNETASTHEPNYPTKLSAHQSKTPEPALESISNLL